MISLFKEANVWFDLSKWNVGKVEDMSYMFFESEFDYDEKLDLRGWYIYKIPKQVNMFTNSNYQDHVIF